MEIQRSMVVHFMTSSMAVSPERKRSFTRYFVCPTTGAPFKATVTFRDTSDYPIESVGEPRLKPIIASDD